LNKRIFGRAWEDWIITHSQQWMSDHMKRALKTFDVIPEYLSKINQRKVPFGILFHCEDISMRSK
jgi:hypothetical protein